jgi:hypothetical protein
MEEALPFSQPRRLSEEQLERYNLECATAYEWGYTPRTLPVCANTLLWAITYFLPDAEQWTSRRNDVLRKHLLVLYKKCPDKRTRKAVAAYEERVNNPECPLGLVFAKWVQEKYGLAFRFFLVVDAPGRQPTLMECPGTRRAHDRHSGLSSPMQNKVAILLAHQVGDPSTHTLTILVPQAGKTRMVEKVKDWSCSCLCDRQPAFRKVTIAWAGRGLPTPEGSDTEELVLSDSDGLEVVGVVAGGDEESHPEKGTEHAEPEPVLHPKEAERLSKAGLPEIKKYTEASRPGRAQRVRPPPRDTQVTIPDLPDVARVEQSLRAGNPKEEGT